MLPQLMSLPQGARSASKRHGWLCTLIGKSHCGPELPNNASRAGSIVGRCYNTEFLETRVTAQWRDYVLDEMSLPPLNITQRLCSMQLDLVLVPKMCPAPHTFFLIKAWSPCPQVAGNTWRILLLCQKVGNTNKSKS